VVKGRIRRIRPVHARRLDVTSNERQWIFGGPEAEVDVLLEPTQGHTADEVARRLRAEGASHVEVLSPGFVSARAARETLDALGPVATAHPKATKRMHRPR
jgi:hypothetical protein